MTIELALKEVKLIESLSMFDCIILDRMKIARKDLYNKAKETNSIDEIKKIIVDYIVWQES